MADRLDAHSQDPNLQDPGLQHVSAPTPARELRSEGDVLPEITDAEPRSTESDSSPLQATSTGSGPGARLSERRKLKSSKLDRTLAELESAFDDWNSVKPKPQMTSSGMPAPLAQSTDESDLKKRTKELLHQLREQLEELSDQ